MMSISRMIPKKLTQRRSEMHQLSSNFTPLNSEVAFKSYLSRAADFLDTEL